MTSVMPGTTPAADRPDYWLPAATAMRTRWQLVRDVRAGTAVLREKASTYLPRFEAEDLKDWTARVNLTFAYDALDQTINTLVGLAFTTEPELGEDVPERIVSDWENIDGEGTHGSIFAQQVLDSALQDGHCLILAEYPPVADSLTLAEEQSLGIRAYLVRVTIDQVPSWRVAVVGGRRILEQVVLCFQTEADDGTFGAKAVTEYRVYRQRFGNDGPFVEWELWRGDEKSVNRIGEPTILRGPKMIPVAIVFGGQRTGFLESVPSLLGLAYSNIDHTQVKSDRRYSMHKCAIPVPVWIGRNKGPDDQNAVVLSMSSGIDINIGGDAKYMEPTGAALDALRQELLDIERRMADQGVSMLQRDSKAAKTATEVEFSRTRQESKLARAVRSLQDALEASGQSMAAYYGLDDGGSIVMRRDFSALTLSDADAAIVTAARERGDLTLETFLRLLSRRGGVVEEIDPEQEAEAVRRETGEESMGLGDDDAVTGAIAPDAAAATPAADVILNGAQITAAKDIVIAVAAGELPRDTGIGMLVTFFRLSTAQAEGIMGTAGTGEPTTPNPNPAEPVATPPDPEEAQRLKEAEREVEEALA